MNYDDIERELTMGMYYVDTPAGIVCVWDTALQARGYTVDDAGAQALAYDLIRDTGEIET